MIREPKKTVSIILPLDLYDQIKKQAEETSRTVPAYIRQVLRRYLWHIENAPERLTDKWNII